MTGRSDRDDGWDDDAEDCLETRLAMLRDIMSSYDRSMFLDLRDWGYSSRLAEAARFLGLSVEASAEPAGESGGIHRSEARLTVSYGGESRTFGSSFESCDPGVSAHMALKGAAEAAGLVSGHAPVPGGKASLDV